MKTFNTVVHDTDCDGIMTAFQPYTHDGVLVERVEGNPTKRLITFTTNRPAEITTLAESYGLILQETQ